MSGRTSDKYSFLQGKFSTAADAAAALPSCMDNNRTTTTTTTITTSHANSSPRGPSTLAAAATTTETTRSIPHPWVTAALLSPTLGQSAAVSSSGNNGSTTTTATTSLVVYQQAHRLLEEIEVALLLLLRNGSTTTTNANAAATHVETEDAISLPLLLSPEQWMEAEDCLWSLSNARTVESIDLCFLLLDKLLMVRLLLQQQQRPPNATDRLRLDVPDNSHPTTTSTTSSPSAENFHSDAAHANVLTNWELWHSILINWQQVCKEYLAATASATTASSTRSSMPSSLAAMDAQIVPPAKLLAMLDGWNASMAQHHQETNSTSSSSTLLTLPLPQFTCTTSKTLSLLIDVTGRRGGLLSEQQPRRTTSLVMSTRTVAPRLSTTSSGQDPLLDHAELGEALLLRMISQVETNVNSFPPSPSNLNMVLNLWAKVGDGQRAWQLLQRVVPVVRPDLQSYQAVLQAYATSGQGAAAEAILAEMCRPTSSKSLLSYTIRPDVTSWNIVLAAWARAPNKVAAAQRVEKMLVAMVKFGNGGGGGDGTWSSAADSLNDTEQAQSNGVDHASGLLDDDFAILGGSAQEHLLHRAIKPNLTTFNTALSAWARVGEAETCARLLGEMRDLHAAGRLEDPPDIFSYATVLNAFAKAGRPDQAEALFDEMYAAYTQHGMAQLKPSIPILTTILDAYARSIGEAVAQKNDSKALDYVKRAENVLQRMKHLNRTGFLERGPDTTAYLVMLTCYLRCASVSTFPRVNPSADLADKLLQEMKQMVAWKDAQAAPDFKTYSIVIQTWLTRPDGVQRAIALLDEIWNAQAQSRSNPRLRPDSLSLHCIIVGFCRANQPELAQKLLMKICDLKQNDPSSIIEPRLASFGSVLGALSRSKSHNSARIAHRLVTEMEELHRRGVISQGPDGQMYRSLASIWAYSDQSAGSAKKALRIVQEMRRRALTGEKSMQPDLITYNLVIFALSRGNSEPEHAELLLRQVFEDFTRKASTVKPDVKSFNGVLTAWARYNNPKSMERASSLFQEMQRLRKDGYMVCDRVSYNIMLNCLAKSSQRPAAEQAELIVRRMKEMSEDGDKAFRPDAISYGCLITAWIRVRDVFRAADVLSNMYDDFQNGDTSTKPQLRHFEQVARALKESSDNMAKEKYQAVIAMKNVLYSEPAVYVPAA
jgi:pentatricopeptide repeat protein